MEIKIKEKLKEYPRVCDIIVSNAGKSDTFYLIGSPVANCQTFSIGGISNLLMLDLTDNDIKLLLLNFHRLSRYKSQMIIDVKTENVNGIMSILSKFTEKYYKKSYTSTNGSKMTLIILQFNMEEIKNKN